MHNNTDHSFWGKKQLSFEVEVIVKTTCVWVLDRRTAAGRNLLSQTHVLQFFSRRRCVMKISEWLLMFPSFIITFQTLTSAHIKNHQSVMEVKRPNKLHKLHNITTISFHLVTCTQAVVKGSSEHNTSSCSALKNKTQLS